MKIIYCYSSEPPTICVEAIKKFAPEAEFVDTSASIYSYNEAIASRWTGEDDLVVIEGDKEINADVIPSFKSCNHAWCTFGYDVFPPPYVRQVTMGLGCAKFSSQIQKIVLSEEFICADPSWISCQYCDGTGCWSYLDTRIYLAILNSRVTFGPHVHGSINHHHSYDAAWMAARGI